MLSFERSPEPYSVKIGHADSRAYSSFICAWSARSKHWGLGNQFLTCPWYSLIAIFVKLKRSSKTFASLFPDIVITVLSTITCKNLKTYIKVSKHKYKNIINNKLHIIIIALILYLIFEQKRQMF